MKPKQKKRTAYLLGSAIVAVAAFAIGLSIPILIQKNQESDGMEKLEYVLDVLENKWYFSDGSEEQKEEFIEQAINGMATLEEDPHTSYFSLEQAQKFAQTLSGSNVGIGVTIFDALNGNIGVGSVFLESAADEAGMQIGDQIVSVNGNAVSELGSDGLVSLIQENAGESMEFEIERDGQTLTLQITPRENSTTLCLDIEDDYGLISLSSFSETSGADFAKAASQVRDAGVDTLILDLRGNTGGYLNAAQEIAAVLLPEKSVVMLEETKDGSRSEKLVSEDYSQQTFDKIIVLQNGNSASASEVLIGALKDNESVDVITVGTTTYGKGTEQVTVPFSDGTSLKYTMAKWYTPDGTSIDGVGFTADREVEASQILSVKYQDMEEDEIIEADTVSVNAQAVQTFLQYLGYDVDRTDMYFSAASSQALARFQQENGLSATGTIDAETLQALLEAVNVQYYNNLDSDDAQLKAAIEIAAN